jgi:DNA-binding IclR family transcriptional regulator
MTHDRVEQFVPLVRKIANDLSRQLGYETSEASA